MAYAETPAQAPGSGFIYSDINFIMLAAVVEKVSGETLECIQRHIFAPLKMTHTRLIPPAAWRSKIAPTEYDENEHMLRGDSARSHGHGGWAAWLDTRVCSRPRTISRSLLRRCSTAAMEFCQPSPVAEDDAAGDPAMRHRSCAGSDGISILRFHRIAAICCRLDRLGTQALLEHRSGSIRQRRHTSFC